MSHYLLIGRKVTFMVIFIFFLLFVPSLLLLIAVDGANHYGLNGVVYIILAALLGISGAILYELKKQNKKGE